MPGRRAGREASLRLRSRTDQAPLAIPMKSSAFSAAPPIKPPSMSFCESSPFALSGFMEPPYWMGMISATAEP